MKSLTIHTLAVAVALMLWSTSSMAAMEFANLPMNPTEQRDTHSANATNSPAPFYALNRLDAQSLAEQEMTDQELKAVEGGHYQLTTAWPMKYDGPEISSGGGWAGAVASASVGN